MARMRRACLASAVRAASARNCEILKSWCVISIADMLPAPRINDMLHRVTVAVVWESPQESGSQAAGISRSNAAGHPGAEIFFDSLCRGGRHRFQEPGAELHAMGAIVGPFAARLDELPGGNDRNMTDDGDGFTLAARLHAQNAETVVFVMKRYTLDEAS